MSEAAAKAEIKRIIDEVLGYKEAREELDKNVHVLDLSLESVRAANSHGVNKEGRQGSILQKDYEEFIGAVRSNIRGGNIVTSMEEGITKVLKNRGSCLYNNLLICKSFSTSRDFISAVSFLIKDNKSFGRTYREKTLSQYENHYDISVADGVGLAKLKGRAFLTVDGFIGIIEEVAVEKYAYKLVRQAIPFTHIAVKTDEFDKNYSIEPLANYVGYQVELSAGIYIDTIDTVIYGQAPIIKKRTLSVLDIGHAHKIFSSTGRTPLGDKLSSAISSLMYTDKLNYPGATDKAIKAIAEYQNKLSKLHNAIKFTFYNSVPDNEESIESPAGYIVLTVQHHKANNLLAVSEARFLKQAKAALAKIAADLPGSNTIKQDIIQKVKNKVLRALGIQVPKIKKHTPVKDSATLPNLVPVFTNTAVIGAIRNKLTNKNTLTTKAPSLRTTTGQFTSLISLQNLLNQNLYSQIQKNMGTGERRDVLNYRTGRFAESVKVEKMSASREGMITAFYSYMRNPYATFSFGGQQANPATRDPKLLISRSIREIGATMVANRMRAVLV